MKPESDDLVLTPMVQGMYDAGRLTELWRNEPREVLERLRRKNAAFPHAQAALRGLLDEIDRREREAGQTEALGLMAGFRQRIASIERQMPPPPKPAWKTSPFWLAWIGIAIAALALIRDFAGCQMRRDGPPLTTPISSGRSAVGPVFQPPRPTTPATPDSPRSPTESP